MVDCPSCVCKVENKNLVTIVLRISFINFVDENVSLSSLFFVKIVLLGGFIFIRNFLYVVNFFRSKFRSKYSTITMEPRLFSIW